MKLLVDIGNTRLKWCLTRGQRTLAEGSYLASDIVDNQVPQDLAVPLRKPDSVTSVWISHVGSARILRWFTDTVCKSLAPVEINLAKVTRTAGKIENSYKNIDKLGVDRWLAVLGARSIEAEGDLLVIDAGTAVTVDWLSANDVFEGGAILPGAMLMHDALTGNTAGIQSVYQDTVQIVGKSTSECVNSGVGYGLVGAVERVVFEMEKVINRPVKIFLTGGAAPILQERLRLSVRVYPDLVLSGLAVLAAQTGAA